MADNNSKGTQNNNNGPNDQNNVNQITAQSEMNQPQNIEGTLQCTSIFFIIFLKNEISE